jgi:hypothetical protein
MKKKQDPKVAFPGQKKSEEIIFILRKCWLSKFFAIIRFSFIGLLPIGLLIWAFVAYFEEVNNVMVFLLVAWLVFAIQYSFISWTNDELDLIIVTNERVIDITQVDFLNYNIQEAPINQIQDVKGEVRGFWGTIFHVGTIAISTANQRANLEIDMIRDPMLSARRILDSVKKEIEDDDSDDQTDFNIAVQSKTNQKQSTKQNSAKNPTAATSDTKNEVNQARNGFASRVKRFFK